PNRPGCPNVGYSYSLSTAPLAPGVHTLTVCATDMEPTPGSGCSVGVPFMVTMCPPSVAIDSPTAGAMLSGAIPVVGWAIDNVSAIGTAFNPTSVQVKVYGALIGTATYVTPRPLHYPLPIFPNRPGCPNVGYSYSLSTAPLAPGVHTLTVCA